MTTTDQATTAWLAEFVAQASDEKQVEAWVDRIAAAALAELPELARDPDLAELVHATVAEQWQAFLAGLEGPDTAPALVPSAARLAAELARRHHELPVLLGAYRSAQREAWVYATEVANDAPTDVDRSSVLIALWGRAGDWLDHALGASILVHQEERRRVRHSGSAQRFEVVRALLAGEEPEPRDVASGLGGYQLVGVHTALLLRALSPADSGRLEAQAHALAARLSAGRPLLVEPGGRELWLWVHDADPARLDDVELAGGLVVAVGGAAPGVEGFRLTHQEALEAQRVALTRQEPSPITEYADVAALALLSRDPEAAERFVQRVLGPVGDDTAAAARMRETLRVVLAHPGHTDAAAEVLHVHKNTVRYRLAQAERALGRRIGERPGDLDLALRYHAAFLSGPPR